MKNSLKGLVFLAAFAASASLFASCAWAEDEPEICFSDETETEIEDEIPFVDENGFVETSVGDRVVVSVPARWSMETFDPKSSLFYETKRYDDERKGYSFSCSVLATEEAVEDFGRKSTPQELLGYDRAIVDASTETDFDAWREIDSTMEGTTAYSKTTGKKDGETRTAFYEVGFRNGAWYRLTMTCVGDEASKEAKGCSLLFDEIRKTLYTTEVVGDVYNEDYVVRAVENELTSLGYLEEGKADGILGSNTDAALRKYQKEKGINVNGVVTDELLDAMNLYEKIMR